MSYEVSKMTIRFFHWRRLALVSVVGALTLGSVGDAFAAAPPDPNTIDGRATLSNIRINGVLGTTAVVAPGADVTISADWSDFDPCLGCINFLAVGWAGQSFAGCVENSGFSGESGTGTVNLGPAPTVPGTYRIVAHHEEVFFCGQFWVTADSSTYTAVVEIVVPDGSRVGYCAGPGNSNPYTGEPIPQGTFVDLVVNQPATDPHYQGAVPANYLQGRGISCDVPPGFAKTDEKVGYAGSGDPGVYAYYRAG